MPVRTTTERRKNRRYQLKDQAYVILRSQPVKLGQLVDITAESVAFRYLADGPGGVAGPQQVDILLSEGALYLQKLPVTTVAEREEDKLPFASTVTRIVAMEFGELSAEQRRLLDELLSLRENC